MRSPPAKHIAMSGPPLHPCSGSRQGLGPLGTVSAPVPSSAQLTASFPKARRAPGPARGLSSGSRLEAWCLSLMPPWKPVPDPVPDREPALIQEMRRRMFVPSVSQPSIPRHS